MTYLIKYKSKQTESLVFQNAQLFILNRYWLLNQRKIKMKHPWSAWGGTHRRM